LIIGHPIGVQRVGELVLDVESYNNSPLWHVLFIKKNKSINEECGGQRCQLIQADPTPADILYKKYRWKAGSHL
jgi:hypothetical protein